MSDALLLNPARHINIEGAANIRDLGGYPTKDGNMTKWGKYFRGDSLHALPLESEKYLAKEKGVQSIIDLRLSFEGKYKHIDQLSYDYINIPLLDPATFTSKIPKSLIDMYCLMLDSSQKQFKEVFQHFIQAGDNPVLFHCRVGKDRTGVLAAMLLDLAGVSHDLIIKDYALTSKYKPVTEEALRSTPPLMTKKQFRSMLLCEPEYMEQFLRYLYDNYGSTEGFLHKIGFNEKEMEQLRASFIEE